MHRILSTLRLRLTGAKSDGGHAHFNVAHNGSELVVETWAGSWTPVANAGAAFVGVLRTAGVSREEIDACLKHAIQVNEARD